ncbi:MAG: DNA-directed RNA polymerase subunit alpha [Candidatus Margulisbacteria bacterium GWF2_35_9]|nr:MAG: DNA-directed RNA polymerase subunit alpha [Candidatus Margulisbacteria bacterium GWF2_35_9]
MRLNTKVQVSNEDNGCYAKIVMDPLDKGYGITLGNSMRRVLLNSLEGSSVTTIKIDGVAHEFGTIEGVKEDLLNIILNIKGIILKSHTADVKILRIDAKKKGEVTAGDIITDADIEIVNKNHKIATITADNVSFKMDLRVERGVGYRLAEQNHYEDMPIGTIPIDSNFTPILKVNHSVMDTRVGNRTDLDKLTMEIWTNGSIDAEEAVEKSSKILIDSFSLFTDYKHVVPLAPVLLEESKATGAEMDMDLTIEDLELSARSSNCLRKAGIAKVSELVVKPMKELMKIKNFGKKSADEINDKLEQYGLKLKDE